MSNLLTWKFGQNRHFI